MEKNNVSYTFPLTEQNINFYNRFKNVKAKPARFTDQYGRSWTVVQKITKNGIEPAQTYTIAFKFSELENK